MQALLACARTGSTSLTPSASSPSLRGGGEGRPQHDSLVDHLQVGCRGGGGAGMQE